MNKLSKLFGIKNIILVFLLSLIFLNLQGYWYVMAVLPIVYALFFNEVYRQFDTLFILLVVFGFWYVLFAPPLSTNEYAIFIFVYPMLYLVGKFLGTYENKEGLVNILFVLAFSMALFYLVSIYTDVAKYGFYTETRNLEIDGRGMDEEIAATGIYSNLVLLISFIVVLFTKLPYKKRILFVLFAIAAFVAAIRIQSRSSVVIMVIELVLFLVMDFKNIIKTRLTTVVVSLVLIVFSVGYVLNNYEEELGVLERFQEEDVETGGHRTELSMIIINNLTENPWGKIEHTPYAHNLWLDCARVSGIVPLFFLLIITIYYIYSVWKVYKQDDYGGDYKNILVLIGIILLIYMNTEPILEGCPLLFVVFVIYLGMLRGQLTPRMVVPSMPIESYSK